MRTKLQQTNFFKRRTMGATGDGQLCQRSILSTTSMARQQHRTRTGISKAFPQADKLVKISLVPNFNKVAFRLSAREQGLFQPRVTKQFRRAVRLPANDTHCCGNQYVTMLKRMPSFGLQLFPSHRRIMPSLLGRIPLFSQK